MDFSPSRINFYDMFSLKIFEQAVGHQETFSLKLYGLINKIKKNNNYPNNNWFYEKALVSHLGEAEGWWLIVGL